MTTSDSKEGFEMRRLIIRAAIVAVMTVLAAATAGAEVFNSGSTGALGAFNPTSNTEVQLPPDGKLNYTNVYIPSNVTVTFKKNETNTPVYMLATGYVVINGTIIAHGSNASYNVIGAGGPGGYDGGMGGFQNSPGGKGLGPGGGNGGCYGCVTSNHGAAGSPGAFNYLDEKLLVITGGSGGGAGGGTSSSLGGAGGSGGGAIVIAASDTIYVNSGGAISANGGTPGNGSPSGYYSGGGSGGSGGSIRLIATTIKGNGVITATGGSYGCAYDYSSSNCGTAGSSGRIRIEAYYFQRSTGTTPAFSQAYPQEVFPSGMPGLRIVKVGGVSVPAVPKGSFKTADILLPASASNTVSVEISATNVPEGSTVTVTSVPEFGSAYSASAQLVGTDDASSAEVSVVLSKSRGSIISASVTFTVSMASYAPPSIDGEKIAQVRLDAVMGGESRMVYITESGREVPAS